MRAAAIWPARVSGFGLVVPAWVAGIAMLLHSVDVVGSARADAAVPRVMLPRKIPAAATGAAIAAAIAAVMRRVMVRFMMTPLAVGAEVSAMSSHWSHSASVPVGRPAPHAGEASVHRLGD